LNNLSDAEYKKALHSITGLDELVDEYHSNEPFEMKIFLMEFALHGLAEYSLISRNTLSGGLQFKDLLSSMFNMNDGFNGDDLDDDDDEKDDNYR
jgi:magnesium chelatase subunit I